MAEDDLETPETPEPEEEEVEVEGEASEDLEDEPEPDEDEKPEEEPGEDEATLENFAKQDEKAEEEIEPWSKLKKDPDVDKVFKKYPALKNAYWRERGYSEQFATVEEAKAARNDVNIFREIQDEIFSGNLVGTIARVAQVDPNAAAQVLDNLLPNIYQKDPEAFARVVNPIFDRAMNYLVAKGTDTKDADLITAVEIIRKELDIKSHTRPQGPDPEKERLRNQLGERERSDYNRAYNDVESKVLESLNTEAERIVDPHGQLKLSAYVKTKLIGDIVKRVGEKIQNDQQSARVMGSLWKSAQQNNYSPRHLASIRNAYLARARHLLPSVAKVVKSKALSNVKPVNSKPNSEPKARAQIESRAKFTSDPKKIDWAKTTDADIFAGRAKLKG